MRLIPQSLLYLDLVTDLESNKLVSDWVKEKIRARIKLHALCGRQSDQLRICPAGG